MKPVPRCQIVQWVLDSWQELTNDIIAKSMKSCGIALSPDGSEDDLISCFKEKRSCRAGREVLRQQMINWNDLELHENPFQITDDVIADAAPTDTLIDDDDVDDDLDI